MPPRRSAALKLRPGPDTFTGAGTAAESARPFIKWVGGKRQLLPQILRYVPAGFATYHEPFLGGGSLFFHLKPRSAVLTDWNERLVRTYGGVRDSVDSVIELLRGYPHTKEFFLTLRRDKVDLRSDAEVAAWFIYLNKTGYNGLYRVNSRNEFNVPFGDYARPTICDEPNLRRCSQALALATVVRSDFAAVLERAKKGDFVYFDPPYVPLNVTSSFTSYTADGFGMDEQRQLRDVALELKRRGAAVLLSNSSAPAVYQLYEKHFEITPVMATRMVNSRADRRGPVPELLIR